MVIDVHTRVWSSLEQFGQETARHLDVRHAERWVRLDASAPALDRAMNCVDVALVHGCRSERLGAHIPNEFVAEVVRSDPQRRIGVGAVDPMGPEPEAQVDHAVELGLSAISVSPVAQGFHPSHSLAMRVYERCAERRLPLFVLSGSPLIPSSMLEFGRPTAWDEVARTFPSLPIVIGEFGFPWVDETMVLLSKHARVYAEVSGVVSRPWQLFNALLAASSLGVMDRLLFGSGFPFEAPAKAIEQLYSVNTIAIGTQLPAVSRAAVRAIVERDALRILGIEHEPVSESTASLEDRFASGTRAPRIGSQVGS
ncbi:MAG: amidohydrolase family protein [Phycisphaerales bacterium]|nr:amidohydrolase family protein [Phycisphaerales bacterium]